MLFITTGVVAANVFFKVIGCERCAEEPTKALPELLLKVLNLVLLMVLFEVLSTY